nr:IS1595 family transposase [Paenibacillus uliginis]
MDEVVHFGKTTQDRQRYKCKCCDKTFTETADTPLYHCRKSEKWIDFLSCLIDGMSLRDSAKEISVHYVTLFYWRHKILTALAQINAEELNGIVEVDETYFLESQKGAIPTHRSSRKRGGSAKKRGLSTEQICVLIARDREKNTFYKVIGRGKPTKDSLELHLGNRLGTDIVLCSDALRGYKLLAKNHHIQQYVKTGEKRVKGIYHIQNINSYHSRLKRWLNRFYGISTKYLEGYIALFNYLDQLRFDDSERSIKELAVDVLMNKVSDTNNDIRLRQVEYV